MGSSLTSLNFPQFWTLDCDIMKLLYMSSLCWTLIGIVNTIKLCDFTALFDIFWVTKISGSLGSLSLIHNFSVYKCFSLLKFYLYIIPTLVCTLKATLSKYWSFPLGPRALFSVKSWGGGHKLGAKGRSQRRQVSGLGLDEF